MGSGRLVERIEEASARVERGEELGGRGGDVGGRKGGEEGKKGGDENGGRRGGEFGEKGGANVGGGGKVLKSILKKPSQPFGEETFIAVITTPGDKERAEQAPGERCSCVLVRVFLCACASACVLVRVPTCVQMCLCQCACACAYLCASVLVRVPTCVPVCLCVCLQMCVWSFRLIIKSLLRMKERMNVQFVTVYLLHGSSLYIFCCFIPSTSSFFSIYSI